MEAPSLQVRDATGAWQTVIDEHRLPGRPAADRRRRSGRASARAVARGPDRRRQHAHLLGSDPRRHVGGGRRRRDDHARAGRRRPALARILGGGHARTAASRSATTTRRFRRRRRGRRSPAATRAKATCARCSRRTDDMFVVAQPGDEIALSLRRGCAAAVAPGWTRTFLLYADGFSKEMDIRSATPGQRSGRCRFTR